MVKHVECYEEKALEFIAQASSRKSTRDISKATHETTRSGNHSIKPSPAWCEVAFSKGLSTILKLRAKQPATASSVLVGKKERFKKKMVDFLTMDADSTATGQYFFYIFNTNTILPGRQGLNLVTCRTIENLKARIARERQFHMSL